MKSLITSVLLFCLMAGYLFWNSHFLSDTSEEITRCLREIPTYAEGSATNEEALRKDGLLRLSELWERKSPLLSLSVSVRVTEGFEDALGRMRAAFDHKDATEFDASREHLLRIAADLHRYDGISVGSIL